MLRDEARQGSSSLVSRHALDGRDQTTTYLNEAQRDGYGSREYAAGGTTIILDAHNVTVTMTITFHPRVRLSVI